MYDKSRRACRGLAGSDREKGAGAGKILNEDQPVKLLSLQDRPDSADALGLGVVVYTAHVWVGYHL